MLNISVVETPDGIQQEVICFFTAADKSRRRGITDRIAVPVADPTAAFLQDQACRRVIPRLQLLFKIAVESSRCHIADG